jgi:hypothetical protein
MNLLKCFANFIDRSVSPKLVNFAHFGKFMGAA